MNLIARNRLLTLSALYAALGLAWAGVARWAIAPWLAAGHPGPLLEAFKWYLQAPPIAFLTQGPVNRWNEFAEAVLIAMALHMMIVAILDRYDWRAAAGGSPDDVRASRRMGLVLGIIAAVFLAVAVVSATRQDYFHYLEIWYHVQHGEDPWFMVWGLNGRAPLNAYGPLFNPMAGLAWVNPVLPRLLFSQAYLLFAIWLIRGPGPGLPLAGNRWMGLLALFGNPFCWIEVPFYGHFDILVALACVGAVLSWAKGWDVRAGLLLAAGVLLKYLPIGLLPLLAIDRDRDRPRSRFLAVALGAIALGLAWSVVVWGPSTFAPLRLAATRKSASLSVFWFLRGRFSPLMWYGFQSNYDYLSPYAQIVALGCIWWWSRVRKPDIEATVFLGALALVVLYHVGHPQYQIVPLILGYAWILRKGGRLARYRTALVVAMVLYFGWIAGFDVAYTLSEAWHVDVNWESLQDAAGLPTFLLGSVLLGVAMAAATPKVAEAPVTSESWDDRINHVEAGAWSEDRR